VVTAILVRVLASGTGASARVRSIALGGAAAFTVGLLLWLPSGPLGSEWARRSGTPTSLLSHSSAAQSKTAVRR
jgi:hypothetical protein